MSRNSRFSVAPLLGVLLLAPAVGSAQDASKLATELSTLRSEVEAMSSELTELKSEQQDQIRTYARQKAELVLELDREKMRLQKLRMAVASRQEEVDAEKARFQDVVPVFDKTAKELREYIESALPFRTDERLADLNKLVENQRSGLISPPKALVRLWGMIEDEFRMTTESGLFQQTVEFNGHEELADVARLGMTMMYFRTSDGQVGYATRDGARWAYRLIDNPDEIEQVGTLFDSFKKQVRVGLFELPNALPTKGQ